MSIDAKFLPNAHYLRSIFNYDPASGLLFWSIRPAFRVHVGDIAGHHATDAKDYEYIIVSIQNEQYHAHRLIWKMQTDEDPIGYHIEHINGDGADNRWSNLRKATRNVANLKAAIAEGRTNQFGMKGVQSQYGKYVSYISIDGERRYLGTFLTAEQAGEAYRIAAAERRRRYGA
jgi:hypothetical protein